MVAFFKQKYRFLEKIRLLETGFVFFALHKGVDIGLCLTKSVMHMPDLYSTETLIRGCIPKQFASLPVFCNILFIKQYFVIYCLSKSPEKDIVRKNFAISYETLLLIF